jgi:hypothetical protein
MTVLWRIGCEGLLLMANYPIPFRCCALQVSDIIVAKPFRLLNKVSKHLFSHFGMINALAVLRFTFFSKECDRMSRRCR